MTMLEAVIPPWLEPHANRVIGYVNLYGVRIWPFLYQQETRFCREHFPLMLMRDKLEETLRKYAAAYGGVEPVEPLTSFDPNKPWVYLFYLAHSDDVDGAAQDKWWQENFEQKTMLVVCNVTPQATFLESDANVAASPAEHFASSGGHISTPTRLPQNNLGKTRGDGGGRKWWRRRRWRTSRWC